MTHEAAKSVLGPPLIVAIEQNYPENKRIISDRLALSMLPFSMKAFVWFMRFSLLRNRLVKTIEKNALGVWGGILCRKRYIDEKLFKSDQGIEAIVNLGAGFDTRLYHMPISAPVPAWEIDLSDNIAQKEKNLVGLLGQIPNHIQLLPVDFDQDDLSSVLSTNGYSSEKLTFFIWEAVSQFLTKSGVQATLNFLSKAKQGSRLIFTYILKEFIIGDNLYGQEKSYKQFVEKGVWLSGLHPEDIPRFLEPYGWKVLEHLGYDELAEKYIEPTGRKLFALPIERMVLAEKN